MSWFNQPAVFTHYFSFAIKPGWFWLQLSWLISCRVFTSSYQVESDKLGLASAGTALHAPPQDIQCIINPLNHMFRVSTSYFWASFIFLSTKDLWRLERCRCLQRFTTVSCHFFHIKPLQPSSRPHVSRWQPFYEGTWVKGVSVSNGDTCPGKCGPLFCH